MLSGQTLGCNLESLLEFPAASNILQPYEPRYEVHCDLHTPALKHFIRKWSKKWPATFQPTKTYPTNLKVHRNCWNLRLTGWVGIGAVVSVTGLRVSILSLLPFPVCWLPPAVELSVIAVLAES